MSLLRTTFVRNAPRAFVRSNPALSIGGRRFASQDYGSGAGDPKGENPQAQGANPSADKEHPGPPPPKAGQGSGSTPTKGTSTGHNTSEAKGGNAQQKKSFSTLTRRMAQQDYGSGAGDPKGENPQAQGPNPSADKEHPGPPPPKAGQGSGSTPTKGTSSGHNTGEAKQGNSQQKKSFSTMARRMKESDKPKSTQDAEPKILSESPPAEKDQPQEVKQHNKEMDERAEQAHEKVSDEQIKQDKVPKSFW